MSKAIRFVYSDRHAYLKTALFFTKLSDLDKIIWSTLQEKNFRKDDLERFEKYQAEALVFKHLPLEALVGIACNDEAVATSVKALMGANDQPIKVVARPQWYP